MKAFDQHHPDTHQSNSNKLAKARKMLKPPGTLGLKKFGLGKVWVEKVWAQNIFIDFLAELDHSIKKFSTEFSHFLGSQLKVLTSCII